MSYFNCGVITSVCHALLKKLYLLSRSCNVGLRISRSIDGLDLDPDQESRMVFVTFSNIYMYHVAYFLTHITYGDLKVSKCINV